MNQKEIVDIGLNLTVLADAICDPNSSPEDVANKAIDFLKEMLATYPKLREFVDDAIYNYDPNCDDADDKWDIMISWINFQKSIK